MFKRLLILIIIFSFCYLKTPLAAQYVKYGLKFNGKSKPPAERTLLDLTPNKRLTLPDYWSIEFDFSIYNPNIFGYVFFAEGEPGINIILSYVQYENTDSSYLFLSVNNSPTSIEIPFFNRAFGFNKLHHLKIEFDNKRDIIKAFFDNISVKDSNTNLHDLKLTKLLFGYHRSLRDVPCMAIRDIKIIDQNINLLLHHLPLDEVEGTQARDIVTGFNAQVCNGEWLKASHFKWKLIKEIKLPYKDFPIVFNNKKNEFYIALKDQLWTYNIASDSIKKTFYTTSYDELNGTLIYDSVSDCLVFNPFAYGKITAWNQNLRSWGKIESLPQYSQYCGARFIKDVSTNLYYVICGYGYYIVKKTFQRYNPKIDKWDTLNVKGSEKFFPRTAPAVIQTEFPGKYYIIGGHGNETGEQKLGFRPLHDLWLMDFNTLKLTLLEDKVNLPHGFEVYDGYYDLWRKVLYLAARNIEGKPLFQIFSYNLKNNKLSKVGQEIETKRIGSVYFSSSNGELYTIEIKNDIQKRPCVLNLYSIAFPPLAFDDQPVEDNNNRNENKFLGGVWLLYSGLIILIVFLFILLRKKIGSLSDHSKIISHFYAIKV